MSAFLGAVPVWVWVVLAVLVRSGIAASRANTVTLWRLALLPLVFSAWGASGLDWHAMDVRTFAALGAGVAAGAVCGWALYRGLDGLRLEGLELHRPGTLRTLGVSMAAFALKFALGAAAARAYGQAGDSAFASAAAGATGATCGLLWAAALTQLWIGRRGPTAAAAVQRGPAAALALKVARGTLPWLAFSLLMHYTPLRWMPLIWTLLIVVQVGLGWRSLQAREPVAWVSLLLFIALFANGYTNALPVMNQYAAAICYAVFSLTAIASVLAGAPFTAVHARRTVPAEMWKHPVFIQVNRVLSLAWAAVFAFNGLLNHWANAYPLLVQASSMALLAGAVVFCDRYPLLMRRRALARSASAAFS